MKSKFFKISLLATVMVLASCSNDDDSISASEQAAIDAATLLEEQNVLDAAAQVTLDTAKTDFIATYARIASANYTDTYTTAVAMQTAIDAFLATPTEATLEAAQDTWLVARDFYGQTEAYREANGPIDNEDLLATEGQINAWPLDEGFIDYVSDNRGGVIQNGLIGDTSFVLTEASILGKNEATKGDDIATGWHAIEFLLWGQDFNYNPITNTADNFAGSGERPFTDYTTAENADRRGAYLKIVTDLLISDLKDLNDTWVVGGSYRVTFEGLDTDVALTNVLNGIGFISNGEVAQERIIPAIDEGQENEHSCFSDNTNQDMWANVNGINNIIVGSYTAESNETVSGTSLIDVVTLVDVTLASNLTTKAATTISNLNVLLGLGINFDEIINGESLTSVGPAGLLADALVEQSAAIADGATALGVSIAVE